MEHVGINGQKYISNYYNLDVIISVGYRVNSKQGIKFRQWAARIIKEQIIKSYKESRIQRYDINYVITELEKRITDLEAKGLKRVDFIKKAFSQQDERIGFLEDKLSNLKTLTVLTL